MTRALRAARTVALSGILLATALGAVLALGAGGARAEDPPQDTGGNLTVKVTDGSTPSPTPTATSSPRPSGGEGGGGTGSGGGGSSSGGSSGGQGSGGAQGGGAGGAGQNPSGGAGSEVTADGILYVGGLESSTALSLDPGEATVTLWFTVRNASGSTVDANARFWMSSVFGNQIDALDGVPVAALQPGEMRIVTAQLHQGGQWTVLNAHVTLTPPESVDGHALTPVTRDATVLLFPWLIALIFVALGAGLLVWRLVRGTTAPAVAWDAA